MWDQDGFGQQRQAPLPSLGEHGCLNTKRANAGHLETMLTAHALLLLFVSEDLQEVTQ